MKTKKMHFKIVSKTSFLFLIIFILGTFHSFSQNMNVLFGTGISTLNILGSNPAKKEMQPSDTNSKGYGGSFEDAQPGVEFRLNLDLDSAGDFRIPIGFDYSFFSAAERIPMPSVTATLQHYMSVMSPYTGIHITFARFPFANAKAYGGIEARGTWVHHATFARQIIYSPPFPQDLNESISFRTKAEAFRLGGSIRVGIEGELQHPIYINSSIAYTAINLVGTNDGRGELFTPTKFFETKESLVNCINFSLMILIKF